MVNLNTGAEDRAVRSGSAAAATPLFLVAGVHKAGTTSLFDYLGRLEGVELTKRKELNFFSEDRPISDYEEMFATVEGARLRVDVSPELLYGGAAVAKRVAAYGGPKHVFMVLRDPVERAISDHAHACKVGAIDVETSLVDYVLGSAKTSLTSFGTPAAAEGEYATFLRPWLERSALDPDWSITILFLEQLQDESGRPPASVTAVLDELGIDHAGETLPHRNQRADARSPRVQRVVEQSWLLLEPVANRAPGLTRMARDGYRRLMLTSPSNDAPDDGRSELQEYYEPSVDELRRLLDEFTSQTERPQWLS